LIGPKRCFVCWAEPPGCGRSLSGLVALVEGDPAYLWDPAARRSKRATWNGQFVMRGSTVTVCTPIRKGHGWLSRTIQSAPFGGARWRRRMPPATTLDPAKFGQVVAVRITEASRLAFTERV
jgi:hypothetical protein